MPEPCSWIWRGRHGRSTSRAALSRAATLASQSAVARLGRRCHGVTVRRRRQAVHVRQRRQRHRRGFDGSAVRAPPHGRSLPARNLAEDPAVLTALGERRRLRPRLLAAAHRPRPARGDIALGDLDERRLARTCSMAMSEAHARGLLTVGLAGYGGGELAQSPTSITAWSSTPTACTASRRRRPRSLCAVARRAGALGSARCLTRVRGATVKRQSSTGSRRSGGDVRR